MFKDGSFLYCDGVNYGLTYSESEQQCVMIMASSTARWIAISRPKTVAPVKAWTVKNDFVRTLTQVSCFNFKKWKLNQGQLLELNIYVSLE